MSFARGKRFNEHKACAPPVGAYDPKDVLKKKGAVAINSKADRFKEPKEITPGPGAFNISSTYTTPSKNGSKDTTKSRLNSTCSSIGGKSASKTVPVFDLTSSSMSSSMESLKGKGQGSENDTNNGTCERCKLFSEQESKDWAQSLKKCKEALQAQKARLQGKLRELELETWQKEDSIRFLKGEISSINDQMLQGEQALFEANAEVAEYKEKLEHLEEQEKTVNKNIRLLSEKYEEIEKKLAEEQSSNKLCQSELHSRLDITLGSLTEAEEDCVDLQRRNSDLLRKVNSEKEEVEKLIYQLDEQKKLSADLGSLLDSKEEVITDLEIHLEASKIELQNTKDVAEKHVTELQDLCEKVRELQSIERTLQEQLEEESRLSKQTARSHADRIMELEQKQIILKEENAEKEDNLKSAVSKCESLEEQVEMMKMEVNKMREEFDMTVASIKETQQKELHELIKTLEQVKTERDTLDKQVVEQTDEICRLSERVAVLCKEKQCAEEKVAASEANLENIVKTHVDETSMSKEMIVSFEEKVRILEEREISLKEEISQKDDKIKISVSRGDSLEETVEKMKTEVSERTEEFEREIREVKEKNESEFLDLMTKFKQVSSEKDSLENQLSQQTDEICNLGDKITLLHKEKNCTEEKLTACEAELNNLIQDQKETTETFHKQLEDINQEKVELLHQLQQVTVDRDTAAEELQKKLSAKSEEVIHIRSYVSHMESEVERYRNEIGALQQQLSDTADKEELEKLKKEVDEYMKWQKMYEDLQAKVEPFMEQLDSFELEKQALLGQSKNAQAEIDKLSTQYAKLLGHQNQKQKIHHIVKIKEENNSMKRELSALREQNWKTKRQLSKLQDQVKSMEGKKFDPAKAFQHSKENMGPPSSPLKVGNR